MVTRLLLQDAAVVARKFMDKDDNIRFNLMALTQSAD